MQRDLLLIALSMLMWGLGEGLYLYLQPVYIEQLGANPMQIGIIYSVMGIIMTAAHIPAGYLADRIGGRPLMWASWIIGTFAGWSMALAINLPFFVIGLMLYSVTAFVMAPLNSYVTAVSHRWSIQRALTTISASYSTGAIIGPWIGGNIAEIWGIRSVYWLSASVFLVSTFVILLIRPQHIDTSQLQTNQSRWQFNRQFWILLGIILFALFSSTLAQPLSSNYLRDTHNLSLDQIGLLGSISNLGVTILGLTLGRINAFPAFLFAQAAVGGFTLFLWKGTSMIWFGIGYFLMGGYRLLRTMSAAQVRDLVRPSQMGLAYGIVESVNGSALILAPLAAGILYQRSAGLMYPVSFGLVLISIMFALWLNPVKKKSNSQ